MQMHNPNKSITCINALISRYNIKNRIKTLAIRIWDEIKKGSVKNILSISSIAKLLFLYSAVVLYIIIFTFDFSPGIFTSKAEHTIAIYSVNGRIGEHRSYIRTLKALDKMGWHYVGSSFDDDMINTPWIAHIYNVAASVVNMIAHTEFNLALTHYVTIVPYGYNITYLNMPAESLYTITHRFQEQFHHLASYDAYIDLASIMHHPNSFLQHVLKNYDMSHAMIIPAYLAQDFEELILPKEYNTAVITGSLWGCNRGSYRFQDAIHKLADEKLLVAYGLPYSFDYLGDGYLGRMEDYGDPGTKLIELQRKGGIALVVHNSEHLLQGLPTSRFSEGIISGSVIISDKHPFLQKYFGNNILYFDSFASSAEIHTQIKTHIEWIKSHPNESRKMTQNAYDIFVKNWTLEIQLNKIMEMIKGS